MKRAQAWLLVVPVLAGLGLRSGPLHKDRAQGRISRVNVNASCNGNSIGITVAPWRAAVSHGEALVWRPHGQLDSVRIATPTNWPFPQIPATGRDSTEISAGTLPGSAPGNAVYHYSIRAFCSGGPTITIDPDIIIGGN
jgi:hypothetical protein